MKKYAALMILGGIFITGLSVLMLSSDADSLSHVIIIIDIVLGIVMVVLGAVFLAVRRKISESTNKERK